MLRYFDRTFFNFVLGFAGILAASFVFLVALGFYEVEVKQKGGSDDSYEIAGKLEVRN